MAVDSSPTTTTARLCTGSSTTSWSPDGSRAIYRDTAVRLVARGAEAVILGCTEIMLLVGAQDSAVPLFDTTELHALAAADRALDGCSLGQSAGS